ncbi:MAG TPA: alpha/beta hydrolase [Pseudonocardiaceae bacterium]
MADALLDIGPRRLSHERGGSGEPMLLVQGMSGHRRTWGERFPRLLAAEFDVLAYDHRGIGGSDRADEPFTIADLADDAAGVIRAAGWSSAHVLGVSMGGMVAQELALRHPGLVRTLTLGCTYGGPGGSLDGPGPGRLLAAMATRDPDVVTRAAFEVNLSAAYRAGEGAYELFRDTALALRVPVPVVVMQAQAAARHDAVARLGSLAAPTLLVHGTEDEMVPVANATHLAGLIPAARLELLPGVGHLFWWERPELTATLVRDHALGTGRPSERRVAGAFDAAEATLRSVLADLDGNGSDAADDLRRLVLAVSDSVATIRGDLADLRAEVRRATAEPDPIPAAPPTAAPTADPPVDPLVPPPVVPPADPPVPPSSGASRG